MKPVIGVPMGDPAGIGPEITVKALASKDVTDAANVVVVGHKQVLEDAMKFSNVELKINVINDPSEAKFEEGTIELIHIDNLDMDTMKIGEIQGQCGKAAFSYIKAVAELAMAKKFDAIATTPINKESLKAGDVPFIGHTEMLGHFSGSYDPLTMFQVFNLRVFFLTRHLSLKNACEAITEKRVYDYIVRTKEALERLGLKNPKIAVAGLNPHCGEHGLMGLEEDEQITPAIERAQKDGIDVVGPKPADSVFHFAKEGYYDTVLSLYHDQGHIATKMVDFHRTIAITNGMPFLRTSVDHGTANDIAGKGIANEVSLVEAIKLGAEYAPFFNK